MKEKKVKRSILYHIYTLTQYGQTYTFFNPLTRKSYGILNSKIYIFYKVSKWDPKKKTSIPFAHRGSLRISKIYSSLCF